METPAFTTIASVRTLAEADMLAAVLRTSGLHPLDQGTFGHFSLAGNMATASVVRYFAGADIQYRVEVPTEEADAAREALQTQATSDASA